MYEAARCNHWPQMPRSPQNANNYTRPKHAIPFLQQRLSEPAPANLFPQRPGNERTNDRTEFRKSQPWVWQRTTQGQIDHVGQKNQHQRAKQNQGIPLETRAPFPNWSQQRTPPAPDKKPAVHNAASDGAYPIRRIAGEKALLWSTPVRMRERTPRPVRPKRMTTQMIKLQLIAEISGVLFGLIMIVAAFLPRPRVREKCRFSFRLNGFRNGLDVRRNSSLPALSIWEECNRKMETNYVKPVTELC